jgi:hypothetical protein
VQGISLKRRYFEHLDLPIWKRLCTAHGVSPLPHTSILDHHNCLAVVIMKGRSAELRKIADQIFGLCAVKHSKFVITTTREDLK